MSVVVLEIDSLCDEQAAVLRVLRCFACDEGLIEEDALRSVLALLSEASGQDESRQQISRRPEAPRTTIEGAVVMVAPSVIYRSEA
ncbi:hypothetical protein [Cupriavidus pinatubonensis]|uniref:hypothetical protein n=1 Tax=Cupriavidus pinatubonensis TaxID=248026 RepID=UPI001CC409CF|nr:hypothetical protein [Cupriavidus pinatubonensis]